MLYIIGLGLNEGGISKQGLLVLDRCHKVFLETYTVDFPYDLEELHLGRKNIEIIGRKEVESNFLIKEATSKKVALLVYGSPLFATTHTSLINDAKEQGVKVKVIYSASVFDAIAETGLQLYKFGKITSMSDWKDKGRTQSFIDVIKENNKIQAHSLILCDVGLGFKRALEQLDESLKEKKVKLDKLIVCSRLGTEDSEVIYKNIETLKKEERKIKMPFCFIIPSEMHFLEKEILEKISEM